MTVNHYLEERGNFSDLQNKILKVLNSWLSNALETSYKLLISESTYEPRITSFKAHDGQQGWKIEDPRTGKVYYCDNDHEVMVWLDSHLY